MNMAGNILVLVEHWRGQLSDITFELLALGRDVADSLGVRLEAALLGSQVRGLAEYLGKADAVLCVEHPTLAEPVPEVYAESLARLCDLKQPRVVLCPLTNVTLGAATLLAARMGVPAVNFCKDLRVTDGNLEARCVLYGGKMETTLALRAVPAVLGIWPGSRPAAKGQSSLVPPVEDVSLTLAEVPRVRFKRYVEPETGDVDISRAEVLVAVGRGIQSKDNLAVAEELAKELGGAVCGSRPVIDQGWLPLSRQVGKSGVSVKAKLYVAAGISGAPEHIEGIRGAETIVAINTDPQAPIFNEAQYGIVGDALDVLPALTEAVRAAKG
jgi:electron transfer flavoprotein alpha subunit